MIKAMLSNAKISSAYFGTNMTNRTMKMMESTAIQLPKPLLVTIEFTTNTEHTDLCLANDMNVFGCRTADEVMKKVDFPVYKHFLKLHSLYFSSSIMEVYSKIVNCARINTLHRLQRI